MRNGLLVYYGIGLFMREFFLTQMDFIFFLYGLSFILLYFTCRFLQKQHLNIPWIYLGVFAVIHGLQEWLDMFSLSADSHLFKGVRLGLTAISFLFLIEFGRLTCERARLSHLGRWIFIPLLLIVLSGIPFGFPAAGSAIRYGLGFLGAGWAAIALWGIAKKHQGGWMLVCAALCMAIYGLSQILIWPQNALMANPSRDLLLDFTGIPTQILRICCITLLAVCLWFHQSAFDKDQMSHVERRLAVRVFIGFVLITILGWILTEQVGQRESSLQKYWLLNVTQQLAGNINPELLKGLQANHEDIEKQSYQALKAQLQQLCRAITSARFVYLMRKVDGKIVFLADSEPSLSDEESPPGQVYVEAPQKIYSVFTLGKGAAADPYTDRWGTWISAFVPVIDVHSGQTIAVLGLDQSAKEFNDRVAFERLSIIVMVGAICVFLLFVLFYWRKFLFVLGQIKEGQKIDLVSQWIITGTVLLLGIIITGVLILLMRKSGWESFESIFNQRATIRAQVVSQELDRQLDRLDGLRRFMDTNGYVERQEFGQYVSPLLKGIPVRFFEWIPRVSREKRASYETEARQNGLNNFTILEFDGRGGKVPAGDREEYFPAFYHEPIKENGFLGVDLFTNPVLKTAMEKSRDLAAAVATPPLVISKTEHSDDKRVFVFAPVYEENLTDDSIADRRRLLKGFVMAAYSPHEFLKSAYSQMPPEGLALLVEDLTAPSDLRVLYRHKTRDGTVDWTHPLRHYETSLEMPDRHWKMTIVPGDSFIRRNLSKTYLWLLPAGLLLSGLLAGFLNFLANARYQAEQLVKLRTAELSKQKDALQRSREDVSLILDTAAEAIYGVDKNGLCTFCNSACVQILGYRSSSDLIGKHMHNLIHHTDSDGKKIEAQDCPFMITSRKGEPVHGEVKLWKADGSGFFAEMWCRPQWRNEELSGAVFTFIDITQRKLAHDALRLSKQRFDQMADLSREVIFEVNMQGLYTYVSHVSVSVYGYTPSELVGKKFFYDLFPLDKRERLKEELLRDMANKEAIREFSNVIVNRDGRQVILSTNAVPMLDIENKMIGYRGIDRDITAAKIAEDILREREAYLSSMLDNFPYLVWLKDVDGHYLTVNNVFAESYNLSASEIIGKTDFDIGPKDLAEKYRMDDVRVMEERIKVVYEEPVVIKGAHCFCETYKSPIFDNNGRVIGTVGFARDITERRKAEAALRESEERYKKITSSITDYIYRVDIENGKPVHTTYSPGCLPVTGYSAEDFMSRSTLWIEIVLEEDRHIVERQLQDVLVGRKFEKIEHRIRHKDGHICWVSNTIVCEYDGDGKLIAYDGLIANISERKKAEDTLKQAKETAERALAMKDEFTSTVSHELRTPLAAIKSSIDILDTGVPGPLTEDQKTFIKRVKSNIDRLARLINDVLDLSKLESGRMAMNLLPVRPEAVVQEVAEIHSFVCRSKGLKLETKFGENLPMLMVDKDRIIQVLNNLINNALKFTKSGGIDVSVRCEDDKQNVIFCVRDTGIGIKPEDMPKLFQKFQQVGGSSKHVGGTGLGLAICKQIIARHDGRIWIESEFGKGSAFYFVIPVKKEKRILIVDDDPMTVELLKSVLDAQNSFEIEMATDGFLAGQKFFDFSPHLVILDIKIPQINGLEVCSRIKEDPKGKNTKIIIISVFHTDLEKKMAWDAGADEIINKPINSEELIAKVRKLVQES